MHFCLIIVGFVKVEGTGDLQRKLVMFGVPHCFSLLEMLSYWIVADQVASGWPVTDLRELCQSGGGFVYLLWIFGGLPLSLLD